MSTLEATRPIASAEQSVRYERNPAVIAAEVGGIAGLAGTAYIHLEELSGKFAEVPYLGVGYALLSVACIAAIVGIVARDRRAWYVAGAATLATIVGFVLTRTVGLPGSTDDIGNWSESIAVWALVFEGLTVGVAAAMITSHFKKA
jgi:hypothetical protein